MMAAYNQVFPLSTHAFPTHALPLADLLFPGVSNATTALQTILAGKVNSLASFMGVCGVVLLIIKYLYCSIKNLVENHYVSSVRVSDSDEARDILDAWTAANLASTVRWSRVHAGGRRKLFEDHDEPYKKPKKPLHFLPGDGSQWFRFEGYWLQYRTVQEQGSFGMRQIIYISCLGGSQGPVRHFLYTCRDQYLRQIEKKTLIFENRNGAWQKVKARRIRRLDTVVLREELKRAWLADIEQFLHPRTFAQYTANGTPWKRGYLIHGPPGTGKTSATLALANRFGIDVYKLDFSSDLDSSQLNELFDDVPERSILLCEDIDAVRAAAACQSAMDDSHPATSILSTGRKDKEGIRLSDLLNAVDGVGSVEGLLLFMTTNHPEKLDPALVRPGRIDKKFEIGYTVRTVDIELFSNFYGWGGLSSTAKDQSEHRAVIEQYAHQFASKMPENEFSPAEVISLFQEHMDTPEDVIEHVDQWVTRVRQGRQVLEGAQGSREEELAKASPEDFWNVVRYHYT